MKNFLLPLTALMVAATCGDAAGGNMPSSTTPPPLPLPVASFGATATPDGSVFIYGGHSGQRHRYNRDEVHGELFSWQPGQEGWEKLPSNQPAQGASLVPQPHGLLLVGGMAARNARDEKQELWSNDTAALFSTAEKRWIPLPPLPQRRSSHDSAVIGDTVYVVGGWRLEGGTRTGGGAAPTWHDTYLTLDLNHPDGGWQSHPQPFQRRALAAQFIGPNLYAIGGMSSNEEVTTAVSVLDTRSGRWSDGPTLPEEKLGGFGFSAIAQDNRLFASGVTGQLLELRGDAWVAVTRLRHPRFFHRLVSGGPGKLIALGGESRQGEKAPPEIITLPPADSPPIEDASPQTGETRAASPTTLASQSVPDAESDWPSYQGPRGNGTTPESGWLTDWPADGPPIAWKMELGKGLGSFAVIGSRVYAAGNDGADQDTLMCIDLETGKVNWKHSYAERTRVHEMPIVPYGPAATPTANAERAWFLSREGRLLCLDAGSGKTIWEKHLVGDFVGKRPVYGYAGSPALANGRLYLDIGADAANAQARGSTLCLDALTGNIIWQQGEGEAGYATPFVAQYSGKQTLVLFKGEALELRDAADGSLMARHATTTRDFCNCATPVQHDGLLFISHTGSTGSTVLVWNDASLTEVWNDRNLGLLFHSGIPWQGNLLVFNDEKRGENDLRLIDFATGKARWQTAEIDKGIGVLADDGHCIILTSKGELVLSRLHADKIEVLQRAQVLPGKSWVQPVLSHHRLLCRNNEGATVCLDLRKHR